MQANKCHKNVRPTLDELAQIASSSVAVRWLVFLSCTGELPARISTGSLAIVTGFFRKYVILTSRHSTPPSSSVGKDTESGAHQLRQVLTSSRMALFIRSEIHTDETT